MQRHAATDPQCVSHILSISSDSLKAQIIPHFQASWILFDFRQCAFCLGKGAHNWVTGGGAASAVVAIHPRSLKVILRKA